MLQKIEWNKKCSWLFLQALFVQILFPVVVTLKMLSDVDVPWDLNKIRVVEGNVRISIPTDGFKTCRNLIYCLVTLSDVNYRKGYFD